MQLDLSQEGHFGPKFVLLRIRKWEAIHPSVFSLHFLLVYIYTFLDVSPKEGWKVFWNPYQCYDRNLKFHPSIVAIICIHLFTSFHSFGIQISLSWHAYLSECYGELVAWIKTENSLSYCEGHVLKGAVSVFAVMNFRKEEASWLAALCEDFQSS